MSDMPSLEIRVLAQQGTVYPVEVTLADTQQVFRGRLPAEIAAWSATGDSRVDGRSLFEALFASADVMRGWGAAHGRSKTLRLLLRLDAPELQTLPWELLRDEPDLVTADAQTPFSRFLAVSREWGQAIVERPIRVLAVISDPTDIEDKYGLPPADVMLEQQVLREAVTPLAVGDKRNEEITITFLSERVTLDRLEAELRQGYHIMHLVGHGAFNARTQQAVLFLQDQDGNAQRVSDDDFAGMLNRLASPPHLVVLAACQSATQSMKAAFSGLGPQLVQIGVPAVIAMQENVTVLTARQFAATFYQRLLVHGTVDLAMNEARGTLITNGRFDAAVPVLFMRLPDGRLWDVAALMKSKSAGGKGMSDDEGKGRSGGVNIGGNAKIGGHVVGQDLNINTGGGAYVGGSVNVSGSGKFVGRDDLSQQGLSGEDVAKLFASVYQKIDAKTDLPSRDKADLKADVKDLEVATAKIEQGEKADETFLERRLRSIARMAPDILDVMASTFANPALGAATVIRKIVQKVQQEAS